MIPIILLILILLLPFPAEASYKIYLKDGSVISGIQYYEKKGGDVGIFFKDGSMHISEDDILKIEGKEPSESYVPPEETKAAPDTTSVTSTQEPASETSDSMSQLKALQTDVDALNEEIRAVNMQETQLTATINEKRNEKTVWNKYQMIQLENELKPLSDELHSVQQKKIELLEKKAVLENQISELKK